jgi:hypothetical protein
MGRSYPDIILSRIEETNEREEDAMHEGTDTSRSALAYQVARRLIYFSSSEFKGLSAVQAAKEKLDKLLAGKQIPESEHRQLFCLLQSLEGCDIDRCERVDDLVQEVTMSLTVWPEVFPDEELERLHGLL